MPPASSTTLQPRASPDNGLAARTVAPRCTRPCRSRRAPSPACRWSLSLRHAAAAGATLTGSTASSTSATSGGRGCCTSSRQTKTARRPRAPSCGWSRREMPPRGCGRDVAGMRPRDVVEIWLSLRERLGACAVHHPPQLPLGEARGRGAAGGVAAGQGLRAKRRAPLGGELRRPERPLLGPCLLQGAERARLRRADGLRHLGRHLLRLHRLQLRPRDDTPLAHSHSAQPHSHTHAHALASSYSRAASARTHALEMDEF
mmetsp:Transcript_5156/g.17226  ORF Transcript_5156/g.17226 Transcript_5156/m.17226 type:complete len:259 (+) Transcript_5156:384-1160(+)